MKSLSSVLEQGLFHKFTFNTQSSAKYSSNVECAENVRNLHVVECECECKLCHIPNVVINL